MDLRLQPDKGELIVTDRIHWPGGDPPRELDMVLNAGLRLTGTNALEVDRHPNDSGNRGRYRLTLDPEADALILRYQGIPRLPRPPSSETMPAGVLDAQGVYLDGASAWYPQFGDPVLSAAVTIHHPPGWQGISQGQRLGGEDPTISRWRIEQPQRELYLLAGPYRFYVKPGRHGEAQAFLRTPDPALARRYLDITEHYLDLYSRLIGPYPYPKFAVLENRWETGYGMPSFTLLGPRVMRLPFILTNSYPHEILHNWWGNSVYPDYATGNWAEGLTSYLADHLIQEQRGQGAEHRLATLQQYADYVVEGRDFALREFRARHDGASQAVGYGKTLMLFHMVRRTIGDAAFRAGLQRLYREYRYRVAGFDDLRRMLEAASGQALGVLFAQWVERVGAPDIAIADVRVRHAPGHGYRVLGTLRQRQPGAPYRLQVPVAVSVAGQEEVVWSVVSLASASAEFALEVPLRPLRIDVDPRFDLFRRLDPAELPPSLGQLFGAARLTVILPSSAAGQPASALRALVQRWRQRYPQLRVQDDTLPLPDAGGVWVLGRANRHAPRVLELLRRDHGIEAQGALTLEGRGVPQTGHSLVFTVRQGSGATLGYLSVADTAAVPALARKLPHYGKYSYLVFQGPEADNVMKGRWPVGTSPLTVSLTPQRHARGALPAEPPLIE